MPGADLIPARGRVPKPVVFEVVRELEPQDLLRLADGPMVRVPPIQRVTARHHRQAQLIAEGRAHVEIAAIVGTTPQRLTQLMKDPTFLELVAHYHDQVMVTQMEDGQRLRAKLVDVAEVALDEIAERLSDEGKIKSIHISELRKVVELGADRTVAPPKSASGAPVTPAQITFNFGSTPAMTAKTDGTDAKLIEGDKDGGEKP